MSGRIQVLRWAKIAGYTKLERNGKSWWLWKGMIDVDWPRIYGPFPTLAAVQEFLKPSKRRRT